MGDQILYSIPKKDQFLAVVDRNPGHVLVTGSDDPNNRQIYKN